MRNSFVSIDLKNNGSLVVAEANVTSAKKSVDVYLLEKMDPALKNSVVSKICNNRGNPVNVKSLIPTAEPFGYFLIKVGLMWKTRKVPSRQKRAVCPFEPEKAGHPSQLLLF